MSRAKDTAHYPLYLSDFSLFVIGMVSTFGGTLLLSIIGIRPTYYFVCISAVSAVLLLYGCRRVKRVGVPRSERCPSYYLSFVIWLWLLAPFVRRYSDYQTGWSELNVYGLAPLVASLVCVAFIDITRIYNRLAGQLLLVMLASLVYGYFVGVIWVGPVPATYAALNWFAPIVLAMFVFSYNNSYLDITKSVTSTFLIAIPLLSLYGLYQFLVLPPWDELWMRNIPMTSNGQPYPMRLRVFSTMNSPMIYAPVTVTGMLLLLARGSFISVLSASIGLIGLGLSLVRSAWGALFIGVIVLAVLAVKYDPRRAVWLVIGTIFAVCCLMVAVPMFSLEERLLSRIETITSLANDISFVERQAFYANTLGTVLDNIIGTGLGGVGLAQALTSGGADAELAFDSGVLEIPMVLGWFGAV